MGTGGIHGILDASIGGGGAERWESGLFCDRSVRVFFFRDRSLRG
jgi:hypothetical protein